MENATNEAERTELRKISQRQLFAATLLPIRTVGVQVIDFVIVDYSDQKIWVFLYFKNTTSKLFLNLNKIFRVINELTVMQWVFLVNENRNHISIGKIYFITRK